MQAADIHFRYPTCSLKVAENEVWLPSVFGHNPSTVGVVGRTFADEERTFESEPGQSARDAERTELQKSRVEN